MDEGQRIVEGSGSPGSVGRLYRLALVIHVVRVVKLLGLRVAQVILIFDGGIALGIHGRVSILAKPDLLLQVPVAVIFAFHAEHAVHPGRVSVFVIITDLRELSGARVIVGHRIGAFRTDGGRSVLIEILLPDDPVVFVEDGNGVRHSLFLGRNALLQAHDIGAQVRILTDQLSPGISALGHERSARRGLVILLRDQSAFRIADAVHGVAFPAVRALILLVEVFFVGEPSFLIVAHQGVGISRLGGCSPQLAAVIVFLRRLVAELIVGVRCHGVTHGRIGQLFPCVVVRFLDDITQVIVFDLHDGVLALADTQLARAVIIALARFASGQVVGVARGCVLTVVKDRLPGDVEVALGQDITVHIHGPGQPGVECLVVDGGLSVRIEQMLLDAEIAVIVRVGNDAVAVAAPGALPFTVVEGLADKIVVVVVGEGDRSVSLAHQNGAAVRVEIFLPCIPAAVVVAAADHRVAASAQDGLIVQIQIGLEQNVPVLVDLAHHRGIAVAGVGLLHVVVEVGQARHILILVALVLDGGIAVLGDDRLARAVHIGAAPDKAPVVALIADSRVPGGDLRGQAGLVEVCLTDPAVVAVVRVDDGGIAERRLGGLQGSRQEILAQDITARIIGGARHENAVCQGGDPLLLIKILLHHDMALLVIFALMDGKALRNADQLIVHIQIPLLQRPVRIVIDIGDRGEALRIDHAVHAGIQVILLFYAAALVIIVGDGGISALCHDDLTALVEDVADQVVVAVILMADRIVTVRKDSRFAFSFVVRFLGAVAVPVARIGDIVVSAFLDGRLTLLIVVAFTGQEALGIPGLDQPRIAFGGDHQFPVLIIEGSGQQMAGPVIGALHLRVPGGGDDKVSVRIEVFFGQDVAVGIVGIFQGSIVSADHVGLPALVIEALRQQAVLVVPGPAHDRGASPYGRDLAVRSVIDLPGQVAPKIIFTGKGGIAVRAPDAVSLRVIIGLPDLVSVRVPAERGLLVAVTDGDRLSLLIIVSDRCPVAHGIVGYLLLRVALKDLHRISVRIQERSRGAHAVLIERLYQHRIILPVGDQRSVGVVIGFLEHIAVFIAFADKSCVILGGGDDHLPFFIKKCLF